MFLDHSDDEDDDDEVYPVEWFPLGPEEGGRLGAAFSFVELVGPTLAA